MSYSLFQYAPQEWNGFSNDSTTTTTSRNLIEFNKIYENLQQQQQERTPTSSLIIPINNNRNNQLSHPQLQQPMASSSSSSISSLSINSLNSQFNQMMLSQPRQQQQQSTIDSNNSNNYHVIKVVDRKKLFVGNLPSNTKLSELLDVFKKFGKLNEKLCVVKDQNYAFIHFYDENEAKIALEEINDSLFKNRYIRVQYSTSQAHIKKSKTFDTALSTTTNGLLKVATSSQVIQPPIKQQQQESNTTTTFLRPITGGNRLNHQQQQQQQQLQQYFQIQRTLSFNSEREAYLAVMQRQQQQPTSYSSLFYPSSSMIKSNTFASFQNQQ